MVIEFCMWCGGGREMGSVGNVWWLWLWWWEILMGPILFGSSVTGVALKEGYVLLGVVGKCGRKYSDGRVSCKEDIGDQDLGILICEFRTEKVAQVAKRSSE